MFQIFCYNRRSLFFCYNHRTFFYYSRLSLFSQSDLFFPHMLSVFNIYAKHSKVVFENILQTFLFETSASSWQRKDAEDTLHKQLRTRTTPMTSHFWQIHQHKPKPYYIVWSSYRQRTSCQCSQDGIHVL